MKDIIYDHHIAIDWAATNMAIARMTKKSNKITTIPMCQGSCCIYYVLVMLSGQNGGTHLKGLSRVKTELH